MKAQFEVASETFMSNITTQLCLKYQCNSESLNHLPSHSQSTFNLRWLGAEVEPSPVERTSRDAMHGLALLVDSLPFS